MLIQFLFNVLRNSKFINSILCSCELVRFQSMCSDLSLKAPRYIYRRGRIIEAIDQPTLLYVPYGKGECGTDEHFA